MVNGVLPYEDLKDLIKSGGITPPSRVSIREDQIGPASFEPTLGDRVFNTPSSMLPFRGNRLLERLESECLYDFSLSEDENRFLHEGKVFVVNLNERFNLPSGFIGESTGRSSIGRTNTVLRLLTDHHQRYNFIPSGYKGGLALEIFSGSFPIEIRRGLSLNQIKLAYGASSFEDQNINLDEADLKMLHSTHPILYNEKGNPLRLNNRIEKNCLVMSLRLTGESPLVLKAKRNVPTSIDFSRDFSKEENRYAIDDFWVEEPVKNGGIILNPGEFYLMITKERIAVPPGYVTKMIPYDINLADLKTQEADLFNPGHGWATKGFCPVLEVKAFGQPIELRDGYPICRIQFQRLRSAPLIKLYDESNEAYVEQVRVNPGYMFR